MRVYVGRSLLWTALLSVVLIALFGWLRHSSGRVLVQAEDWVEHTREVDLALERLLSAMRDAETGQRGYLLVGQDEYLQPYQAALPVVQAEAQRLRALTQDNPRQQERLDALQRLIDARLQRLAEVIEARHQSAEAGAAAVAGGEGKRLMDAIRVGVAEMQHEEAVLLSAREQQAREASRRNDLANVASTLLAIALVVVLLFAAQRDGARLRLSEQRLAVIFRSIGDAVIATDAAGRVERMNLVAEALTGWSAAQAAGRPLEEVFRIVNEDTREPVESPVRKVIREGGVVGLANHTVLLRPDGSEAPIADSAAPIGEDGHGGAGIVLVFRDASEARALELERSRSEERFRRIADAMPQIVYVVDAGGLVEYVNQQWVAYTGFAAATAEEFGRAIHEADREALAAAWAAAFRDGTALTAHIRLRDRQGSYRWFLTRAVPLPDPGSGALRWYGTSTDIDEQIQARQLLAEADRRKDEFLATLAHELRNPLAPIRNASHLLRLKVSDEASRQWASDVIDRQVRAMGALLDDLLEVSRITRGTLVLQKQSVTLASIIEAAVELARPAIDAHRHVLELEFASPGAMLEADPLRLTQVVGNLLNNAAKYTDNQGRIHLSCGLEDELVWISVRDTGIGLEASDLTRVFDMFSQVNSGSDRSEGGLGIGLALVKGLVELHGGRVSVRSDGPGRGSEFRVEVPRGAPAAGAGDPRSELAAGSTPSLKVLVADDNRDGAESLALLLNGLGHEVRVAFDGHAASELAAQGEVDVALVDLGMPRVDGFEVARRLRSRHPRALIVAVTGWGHLDDRSRTQAAGFDHHLVKPVDPQALIALLADRASTQRTLGMA